MRFRYRLDGFDRDWSEPVAERQAVFTNLGPGTYRFRVIASNSDGVWNNQGAALDIFVAAPFYRAWWFIALVALGAVAGPVGVGGGGTGGGSGDVHPWLKTSIAAEQSTAIPWRAR